MRLIATFDNEKHARLFSNYLSKQGIDNLCDVQAVNDWGSNDYGMKNCTVWVIDEDSMDKARERYEEFAAQPDSPKYAIDKGFLNPLKTITPPLDVANSRVLTGRKTLSRNSTILTLNILIFCCLVFFWSVTNRPAIFDVPNYLPLTPIASSPIEKAMYFDYPETYQLTDKLVALYGLDHLQDPSSLPEEGKALLQQLQNTPYWRGIYEQAIVQKSLFPFPIQYQGKMFEKIQAGEWWRLVSPIFLHGDFFHLLFNMIWLVVLGNQLEIRLGKFRYLILIIVSAVISNVTQYLMGGANFIGYSGVVCAMLTFMWARQRTAPWEGYLLQRSTVIFIAFFVLAMFGMQVVSFFFEYWKQLNLTPGIANTAHLVGALVGYGLGKLPFFAAK